MDKRAVRIEGCHFLTEQLVNVVVGELSLVSLYHCGTFARSVLRILFFLCVFEGRQSVRVCEDCVCLSGKGAGYLDKSLPNLPTPSSTATMIRFESKQITVR